MRLISLIGKFRRIVENQDLPAYLRSSIASCLKMARQNGVLVDALIRKKAVSRLRVGPVLAHEGDGFPHSTRNLSKQLSEPLEKPSVLKLASGELSVNPDLSLRRVFSICGSPHQWRQLSHRAAPYRRPNTPTPSKVRRHPSIHMSTPPAANQVLNNESQAIPADQASTESRKASPVNRYLNKSS
jgi:hypothetical protein